MIARAALALAMVAACNGSTDSPLDHHIPGVPPGSPAIAPPNDPPAPPDAISVDAADAADDAVDAGSGGWADIGKRYKMTPTLESATGAPCMKGYTNDIGESYQVPCSFQESRGNARGRVAAVPTVSLQTPTTQGQLDKAIIRRYINRNINKIQYCYERQLLTTDSLSGTVTAQFTIKPDGTVGATQATGVDATMATCIADVIKTIEFPKPKDGNPVQVSYPFEVRRSSG